MANKNISIIALTAILVVMMASLCHTYSSPKTFQRSKSDSSINYRGCRNDYNFDYMRLALQWSPGLCEVGPEHCYRKASFFTIHGLWLNRRDGNHPQDCCFQDHFEPNDLKPIQEDLDKFWISLYGPSESDNERFWSHEWLKHGTCAKNVPELKGELSFFKKTLELFKDLKLDSVLGDAGIVPSNTTEYRTSQIIDAISTVTDGKKANIECMMPHDFRKSVPLLTTMSICLDKNLQFIDCPLYKSGHCKDKIIFPST